MIEEIIKQATTTTTSTSVSYADWLAAPLFQQLWSLILQLGSLSGLFLLLYNVLFRRVRLKVEFVGAELVDKERTVYDYTLSIMIRLRNKSRRSTSLESIYHEWVENRGPRHGAIDTYRILTVREVKEQWKEKSEGDRLIGGALEESGEEVSLPVRILGDTTRTFRVQLTAEEDMEKHRLVVETTHKRYVKRLPFDLSSDLFRQGPEKGKLGALAQSLLDEVMPKTKKILAEARKQVNENYENE